MVVATPISYLGKGVAVLLGVGVIALAAISYLTSMPLTDMIEWAQKVLGWSFALLFSGLLVMGLVAIKKLKSGHNPALWFETGQQAGNGISTLALTFTLLGISLGIGSLSEQPLNPENIQPIIANLTSQFSTAFMTTVVGLPAASLIRAWVGIQFQLSQVSTSQLNQNVGSQENPS
ncbi:hypothetical protein [uncultured Paraglaciecola sp.]|uniref:hypothetical protein n=1 Tax=uncultured Paraglaciecola sp. TaxID=1765024 RepID=UPI0026303EC1|nr:hypothetical protein [uncultured Paraglaciecola sp.]